MGIEHSEAPPAIGSFTEVFLKETVRSPVKMPANAQLVRSLCCELISLATSAIPGSRSDSVKVCLTNKEQTG